MILVSSDSFAVHHLGSTEARRSRASIERLVPNFSISADIAFGDDGSIGLMWAEDATYFYLDILADGRLHFYLEDEDGGISQGISEAFAGLPEGMLRFIRSKTRAEKQLLLIDKNEASASPFVRLVNVSPTQDVLHLPSRETNASFSLKMDQVNLASGLHLSCCS